MFFAFYYNNLFPEQIFHIGRSIEIILAPDHRRHRHAVRPDRRRVRADRCSPRACTEVLQALGVELPGVKQVFYGVACCWSSCSCRTASGRGSREGSASARRQAARAHEWRRGSSVDGVSKSFRGLRAVPTPASRCPQGDIVALIGPNGAGKTTLFNMIAGVFAPDARRRSASPARDIDGLRPDQVCAAGIGRTFQIVKPVRRTDVLDNVMVGALARGDASARRCARRPR